VITKESLSQRKSFWIWDRQCGWIDRERELQKRECYSINSNPDDKASSEALAIFTSEDAAKACRPTSKPDNPEWDWEIAEWSRQDVVRLAVDREEVHIAIDPSPENPGLVLHIFELLMEMQ
jgi:hypothetical protein